MATPSLYAGDSQTITEADSVTQLAVSGCQPCPEDAYYLADKA